MKQILLASTVAACCFIPFPVMRGSQSSDDLKKLIDFKYWNKRAALWCNGWTHGNVAR